MGAGVRVINQFLRLGKETVVYGFGQSLARFAGLLLLPLYTRVFAPGQYGAIDAIATIVSLASVVLTAGTETALSYYYFRAADEDGRRRTVSAAAVYLIGVNTAVAVAVWLAAPAVCRLAFGDASYAGYLRLAIAALPFTSFVALNFNVLRLKRRPWTCVALSAPQALLTLILNLILVGWLGLGISGVFWSNLVTAIAFAAVGSLVNRPSFAGRVDARRIGQLLRYGLPLVIGGLSLWTIGYVDRFFLLRYAALSQLGVYAIAVRVAGVMALVTQSFRTANAPFQFESSVEQGAPELYARTLPYYLLGTMVVAVPLSLFARPALQLLATAAYVGGYVIVPIVALSLIAHGLYQLAAVGLVVQRRTGQMGLTIAMGAVLNAILLWLAVPRWGIMGAAVAGLLARCGVVVLLFALAHRALPVPYDFRWGARIVAIAAAIITAGLALSTGRIWSDVAVATIGSLVFLALIPALSLLDRDALNELRVRAAALMRLRA